VSVLTPPPDIEVVRDRVAELRSLVAQLRGAADAVAIVAVTKTFDASAMDIAHSVGCDAVGENYAQELLDKLGNRRVVPGLPVHFIGHLQSNKVKALFDHVALWHTVDRPSLVSALGRECERREQPARVLIQVNSTGEDQKSGCAPTDVAGLVDQARAVGLTVSGLMTMGPSSAEPVETRRAFRLVASLREDLGLAELSMGMTHDVRSAIDEGATIVRIGSGLFGERPRSV
jgi:PLP dependent protein